MRKTYTKIILGTITFFWALLGPFSVVIQPTVQQAGASNSQPVWFVKSDIAYATTICSATWPNLPDCVPASSSVTPTNNDLAVTLESFLKVVYVILWPALFIAGLAMDNSLVYGEIFWLDNALFKFWQIMKNFANFALGFIFVFSILKYIFDMKWGKATNPKDIIVKLLLGAVWVNMSWFVVWAMVDLSTVLTVWIWGLPLQLIWDQNIADKPIFWSKTSIKLNDAIWQQGNVAILYTRPWAKFQGWEEYLLPCYIEKGKVDFWPKRQEAFGISNGAWNITWTNVGWNQIVKKYCVARWNGIGEDEYNQAWVPDTKDPIKMGPVYTTSLVWLKKASGCDGNNTCQTLKSFTKKTEWYQWAFYSLYASLLNLSTIHIWVPKSNVSLGMEMLVKMLVALAYLIPLLILAVVLIMRVWYLWLIIAFSPFIVLSSIKWFWVKALDGWWMSLWWMKTKFNLGTVVNLLLLPVIVTFTISLSIVFLSSLSEWLTKTGTAESMWIYQRTEWSYKCYDIAITNICLDMPERDVGTWIFDYFSWMIMNLFGIWLMWFAVMAALKSSEFTSKVAWTIEWLGKNLMMSANFIPIPWSKESTSLAALGGLKNDIDNRLRASRSEWSEILSHRMAGMKNDILWADKVVNEAITNTTKAVEKVSIGLTGAPAFTAQQKEVVNGINSGKFKAAPDMSFWQADNSLAFANMLAEKWWFQQRFKSWQELFTTEGWQQVLAKWLNNKDVDWSKVKEMYGDWLEAKGWEDSQQAIKNIINPTWVPEKWNIIKVSVAQANKDMKYYKKWKDLLLWNDEKSETVFSSTDELDKTITDINQITKDDKNIEIASIGELTVWSKKYILKKWPDGIIPKSDKLLVTTPPPSTANTTNTNNTASNNTTTNTNNSTNTNNWNSNWNWTSTTPPTNSRTK